MVLMKDRNGDFVPTTSQSDGNYKKKVKIDATTTPDGFYDAPWSDVDTVITSILKSKMNESVSKNSEKGMGRQTQSQLKLSDMSKGNVKKVYTQHNRQISVPEQW